MRMHSVVHSGRGGLVRLETFAREITSLTGRRYLPAQSTRVSMTSCSSSSFSSTARCSLPHLRLRTDARAEVLARARGRALQELLDRRDEDMADQEEIPKVTKLEWQSPLEIIKYPDPRLRASNASVGCFDGSLRKISEEMFELMYQDDGVGLAAPQVGVNVRLMVFNETGDKDRKDAEVVLVNPRIISTSKDKKYFEEGCLSFPGMYADVIRPSKVRVSAQDLDGKRFTINIHGFPARIFQHEFDHLQGVLFCDRWVPEGMEKHRDALVAMEEEYLKKHPQAEIQRIQQQA